MRVELEAFRAAQTLEQAIKSLGPNFSEMYVVDRSPGGPDDELDPSGPRYLEWADNSTRLFNMDPSLSNEVVRNVPELRSASQGISELKQGGYLGFPRVGQFSSNCFVYNSPDGIFLVVGRIEQGEYCDELTYLQQIANRLTRRFIDLGVPDASARLQLDNYPGISTKFSTWNPADPLSDPNRMHGREATYKIKLSYEEPNATRQPTKQQVLDTIAQMLELEPACNKVPELQQAGYDGWNDLGVYPDDVYVLDVAKMPNHIPDRNYPTLILFNVYNSSTAVVPKVYEQKIQTELNQILHSVGYSDVAIEVRTESGPDGPNYFAVSYNGYCAPEDRVREALFKIPGISPNPTKPLPVGTPGFMSTGGQFIPTGTLQSKLPQKVTLDLTKISSLANLLMTSIDIYLTENVEGY